MVCSRVWRYPVSRTKLANLRKGNSQALILPFACVNLLHMFLYAVKIIQEDHNEVWKAERSLWGDRTQCMCVWMNICGCWNAYERVTASCKKETARALSPLGKRLLPTFSTREILVPFCEAEVFHGQEINVYIEAQKKERSFSFTFPQ